MSNNNKTVVITGASSGFGESAVKAFADQGYRVWGTMRDTGGRNAAKVAALEAHSPAISVQEMDVADDDSVAAGFARITRDGPVDILINNALTFYPTPVGQITLEHWRDLIGSNLQAPLFLSQAAAPELKRRHGLMINIVDIHGVRPLRDYPTYSIAKAGLIMLTKSMARELAPEVRVNGIAPGPVMWPEDGLIDAAAQQKILSRTPLKRAGSPEDIARAALFFAMDAPYVTGHIMPVDGGRSVGW
jgi:pteridine reductase